MFFCGILSVIVEAVYLQQQTGVFASGELTAGCQEHFVPNDFSVLIVEDDDDARQNMEDILSLDGYSTQTAAHCLEAESGG